MSTTDSVCSKTFEICGGWLAERVEIFSVAVLQPQAHPVTTGAMWWVLTTSKCGLSGSVSALNTQSKFYHTRVSARAWSLSCLYSKVDDHISVSVDFDDVFECRISDDGYGGLESLYKFQRQTYASQSHQTEVVVFAEVGCKIERVQGISTSVVITIDEQSLVRTQFARSSKDGDVRSYILSRSKIPFYRSLSVLLLSVEI